MRGIETSPLADDVTNNPEALETASNAADAIMQGLPALVEHVGGIGQAMLVAGLALGLVLWVMGRRLARPGVAIGGMVIGGLIGTALPHEVGMGNWMFIGSIAGAIVCGVLAWALFRVWMGIACAIMLALVAPAAALIWQGQAPDVSSMEHADFSMQTPVEGTEGEGSDGTAMRDALWQRLQVVYEHEREQVAAVWEDMGSAGRTTVTVAAAAGAIGGLLAGLILPYMAASLQSALVGAVLIFFCGMSLAHIWAPDLMAKVPEYSVRLPLLVIGLIAVHGIGIQWTLSRRRTDR